MKVLVAQEKATGRKHYFTGRQFSIRKKSAMDISNTPVENIECFLAHLYKHIDDIKQTGTIDYFVEEMDGE